MLSAPLLCVNQTNVADIANKLWQTCYKPWQTLLDSLLPWPTENATVWITIMTDQSVVCLVVMTGSFKPVETDRAVSPSGMRLMRAVMAAVYTCVQGQLCRRCRQPAGRTKLALKRTGEALIKLLSYSCCWGMKRRQRKLLPRRLAAMAGTGVCFDAVAEGMQRCCQGQANLY
jgi:hypothetical protein